MTFDQRRSALNALRDELHDEVQYARHLAETAAREGRVDVNGLMAHWQMKQSQLNAIDEAIEEASHKAHNDNRIEVPTHLVIVAIIAFAIAMIPILSALFGVY